METPSTTSEFKPLVATAYSTEDDTNPYAAEIKAWTTYTQYLFIFAAAIETADRVLKPIINKKNPALYKKLNGAFHAVYDAAQGVDLEFVKGIKTMQKGTAPTFPIQPAKIPNWPDPGTGTSGGEVGNIIDGIWKIAKGTFELILSKVKGSADSPNKTTFEAAIMGLLNAGDKMVADLKQAFS